MSRLTVAIATVSIFAYYPSDFDQSVAPELLAACLLYTLGNNWRR
ncbi:hypothetical protein [Aliterella atlantica]|nr:hypothetical protein [Aliterella atlantica]